MIELKIKYRNKLQCHLARNIIEIILYYFLISFNYIRNTKFNIIRYYKNSITFAIKLFVMLLSFLFYHTRKELCFFNNIAILRKFLKTFPSDILY